MKSKDSVRRENLKSSALSGFLLVVVAVITLEGTSLVQYLFSRKGLEEEAIAKAESQLDATRNKILDVVDEAEAAVRNSVWIAQWCLNFPDSLERVAQRIVTDNPVVIGSTVALVPGYSKRYPLFSPYVFTMEETLIRTSLATPEYDYPNQEWFVRPIELESGYWSEPYIDEGGGEVLMTTYSLPIRDMSGRIAAVLTADVSLDWLSDYIGSIHIYPNSFNMVVSREGRVMVCPEQSLVMHASVEDLVKGMDDSLKIRDVNSEMLSGASGHVTVKGRGMTDHVFYAPVERTGWSMALIIPENEIFSGLKRVGLMVLLMQLIGILLIIFIIYFVFRNQKRFNDLSSKAERVENELQVARDIQMSMVPKIFPPFPERDDIDMSATIVPAKEVGGDLYDFYIRDEQLFFCIGDVSGKGVPASLVMAVTRSLFRSMSAHECSPAKIVAGMNTSMSENNENNMFVTLFCGKLDMQTGHLLYCNAGHNAPMLLTDHIAPLPVDANLPLGVLGGVPFSEQEINLSYDDALFLYTDGLTEAENINHELYGEFRMEQVLHGRKSADAHMATIRKSVADFVGDAPQSDDMTMLFIHYLNKKLLHQTAQELIMRNDITEIERMAEFVHAVCDAKQLPTSLTMSINLALEEAVTNVIMYAYPEGTEGEVRLDALQRPDEIEFVLSDTGMPFDPTAAEEADITLGIEDRKIGGLGIFLVRNIMDKVAYEYVDGRNVLRMIKKLA